MTFNDVLEIICESGTGKRNAAIDSFSNMLKVRAMNDKIKVNVKTDALGDVIIFAKYDNVNIKVICNAHSIVQNMSNMRNVIDSTYEHIKKEFIEAFEEIASNQEEPEFDERWELIDLGGV